MPPGAKRSYRRVTPRGSGVGFCGNLCRHGLNIFIVTLCALRNKWFHCNIVRLAEQHVFIVTLCALRPKMLETCDPAGVRCGKWIWSILSCNWFWIRIYMILRIKDDVAVLRGVVNYKNLYIAWNFVDAIIAAAKSTEKIFISINTMPPPATTFYLILEIL